MMGRLLADYHEPPQPIVDSVTALSYLFLAISIGLLVALAASRRGGTDLPVDSDVQAPDHESRRGPAVAITAAAAAAPLGIVIQSISGERLFENEAAATYSSGTVDDAFIGLRVRNLIATAEERGDSVEQQIEVYGPSPRTLAIRATPLLAGDEHVGTVAFIDDLTNASRVDSMRTDFIANASHELKTPLGAMRLLAEALLTTDQPEVTHDLATKIQGEAERMTRLVEDILDLALEEEAAPEADAVNLCDVIGDAVSQLELLVDTKAVSVTTSCSSATVAGNRRRLVSAVANLIENAINYTAAKGTNDPAPVTVRSWSEGKLAIIEVEDKGIGIPGHHQDRIFERFYRVDRGRSRASGGTGLGLAIARHVVENHHGKISVASVSGEGSTFRIEIPALED